MNITIAGYGFVGQAHEAALKNTFDITVYDPNKGYHDFGTPNGVIVCVSTPQSDDGSCDSSNVIDVIGRVDQDIPILIRSTVSLEGWQKLKELYPSHKLAFAPEFLRSASAIEDFLNTRELYIGGDEIGFWHAAFRIAYDDSKFTSHIALPEELILAKYFRNSFLATKVAFFNQVYDLCAATGVDYEIVRHVVTKDARIGDSHTTVTPERGFGGHCFPKDTTAIVHTAKLVDVDLSIIQKSIEYNNIIRKLS